MNRVRNHDVTVTEEANSLPKNCISSIITEYKKEKKRNDTSMPLERLGIQENPPWGPLLWWRVLFFPLRDHGGHQLL